MMNRNLITLIVYCLISSCSSQGHRGTSSSIEDAKKRGVFIKEYCSPNQSIKINDTIQFEIKEAWLEYQWRHSVKSENNTAKYEEYEIRISTARNLPNRLGFTWSIGVDYGGLSLRSCNKDCLIGDFTVLPPDTITYPVITGRLLKSDTLVHDRIIGEFTLIAQ